jgi:hypothetical protein
MGATRSGRGRADPAEPAALAGVETAEGLRVAEAPLLARVGGRAGLAKLLRPLTVREIPAPGRPRGMALATRSAFRRIRGDGGPALLFPRCKGPALSRLLDSRLAAPSLLAAWAAIRHVPPERLAPAQPLYAYQEAAVAHLSARWAEAPDAFLQMQTGLGKTRVGLAAAARVGGPAFVVVPTLALRVQWLEEAAALYPGLRCGSFASPSTRGPSRAPAGPAEFDLVVGIQNTSMKQGPAFFADYALVILDEAHELCAAKNQELLWLAQAAPRTLGLSATPLFRPDGLDRLVPLFLGPPIVAEADIPRFDVGAVSFRGRVREVDYRGEAAFVEPALTAAGTTSAVLSIASFAAEPARLHLVVAEVERLYFAHLREPGLLGPGESGRRHCIFVFAEFREYLPALREALLASVAPAELLAPPLDPEAASASPDCAASDSDSDCALLDGAASDSESDGAPCVLRGGASAETLQRARDARVVLTTYGFSRRGVSLRQMTALVLATPRRNGLQQIIGRITRRGSDESILRQVVDIRDVCSPLKAQSADRRKAYKERGFPIFNVKASYSDFAEPGAPAPPSSLERLVWSAP